MELNKHVLFLLSTESIHGHYLNQSVQEPDKLSPIVQMKILKVREFH